jgi:hypothetical protein
MNFAISHTDSIDLNAFPQYLTYFLTTPTIITRMNYT